MDHRIERFIRQEAEACYGADPEMLTVFGSSLVDWFHPKRENIGAVYIGSADGQRVTILVCRPMLDYEPTIIHFWQRDKLAENKAVYFCPNALLIVRPTEEGDESLINVIGEEA